MINIYEKDISYAEITDKEFYLLPVLKKDDQYFIFNQNFFYEKLESYRSNKKDYGQYLWNEITLNFMLQKKLKI